MDAQNAMVVLIPWGDKDNEGHINSFHYFCCIKQQQQNRMDPMKHKQLAQEDESSQSFCEQGFSLWCKPTLTLKELHLSMPDGSLNFIKKDLSIGGNNKETKFLCQ